MPTYKVTIYKKCGAKLFQFSNSTEIQTHKNKLVTFVDGNGSKVGTSLECKVEEE